MTRGVRYYSYPDHSGYGLAALAYVRALHNAGPKAYDTVIVPTVPEHWPAYFERGKRNIGYAVWETDALPAHWRPLLDRVDTIFVPSAANRALFESAGIARRVVAVPHVRRHGWSAGWAEGRALRRELGVPDAPRDPQRDPLIALRTEPRQHVRCEVADPVHIRQIRQIADEQNARSRPVS